MGNSKIVYYGETLIDLTGDTVEAAKLLKGVTAHDKKGDPITGTFEEVTPYAIISVTYPEGSVCTCSSGSVTLTAKDTSGKALFVIPFAGTWTVKAVSGSKSKSKAVSITAEGQVETVELGYSLVIYEAGVFGANSAGTQFSAARKDDNNNASSITKESSYMLWECDTNAYCMFYISPKASCAGYKTLNISVTNARMTIDTDETGKGKWGLSSSTNVKGTGFVAVTNFSKFSGSKTLTLDVSNVGDTEYYVAMQFGTPTVGGSFSARVTKIWLE